MARHPLLGVRDSRTFKIYRTNFPAIFRFNGVFYRETASVGLNPPEWTPIPAAAAVRWLDPNPMEPADPYELDDIKFIDAPRFYSEDVCTFVKFKDGEVYCSRHKRFTLPTS